MGWILVTGGAKRLGKEIALFLAREGYDLLIHYRTSRQEAEETVQHCKQFGGQAKTIQGDFSSFETIKDFLSRVEEVRALINNVGAFWIQSGLCTSLEKWEELFQLNFFAPLALIQGLAPSLKANRGSIVNIGTAGAGIFRADAKYTAYTASKMALWITTKSLAKELASDGVRVNMVSPGELEISSTLHQSPPQSLPMGRPGTCEEVARAVAFLLDDRNPYITGQNIEVGGGFAL